MAVIRGTEGRDRLNGTPQADTIYGLGEEDQITANAGADMVYGGRGGDSIDGGSGNDLLYGEDANDSIDGRLGDDRLFGGPGIEFLTPGAGNDRVFGEGGGDFIADYDEIDGRPSGNDFYDGGAGSDTVSFVSSRAPAGVRLTLGEAGITTRAVHGGEVDLIRNVERVEGSLGDDVLIGNSVANSFRGNLGNDRLEGRGGNDFLDVDSEEAGSSNYVHGGSGDDILNGSLGADRFYGGVGADTLYFGADLTSAPRQTDFVDLGVDAQSDTVIEEIANSSELTIGFGVDRVLSFGAQDNLDLNVEDLSLQYSVRSALDSDSSGRIDNADADVRLVGRDLVLDVDASYQRVTGEALGIGDQHIVLQNVTGFDVDQLI